MSGIMRRTIFIDVISKNGDKFHKFWDWARVTTGIGNMAEPFHPGQKYPYLQGTTTSIQDYDPEDMMGRIDNIEYHESEPRMLGGAGDDPPCCGGVLMTKDGR